MARSCCFAPLVAGCLLRFHFRCFGSPPCTVPAATSAALACPQADWQFLVSTNLESAFMLSQAAFPLLKASGDGVVLFNSRWGALVYGWY